MKYVVRLLSVLITATIVIAAFSTSVSAEGYTHWYTKGSNYSVPLSDVYESTQEITGNTIGLTTSLDGINDLFCINGYTYALCSELSKIVVLDSSYNLHTEIFAKSQDGKSVDFTGARGLFVDEKNIFIADTENARVLICDGFGTVEKELFLPKASVIPDTYVYRPIKVVKDQRGYVYVVSEGSYYGALLFDEHFEFLSFYGANEATTSVKDAVQNLWNRYFATETQLSKQKKTLPYQFSNFCVGDDGFLYTSTGATELWSLGKGQIVKLSPGGANILYRYNTLGNASLATNFNFGESTYLKTENVNRMQSFCDLFVDRNSFIYALDQTYGLIYLYDSRCNLITAFGGGFGKGDTVGEFQSPTAITLNNDELLVSDSLKDSITIFKITDFGAKLIEAQKLKIDGNYEEAFALWKEVLEKDSNCQMAYSGLANAYFEKGEYDLALKYAKDGQDYFTYSQIYETISKEYIRRNVTWIVLVVILIVTALVYLVIILKKKIKPYYDASDSNKKLYIPFRIILHPVDSFNDMKYKRLCSVPIGISIAVMYYITSILAVTAGGFLFTSSETSVFNSLFVLARTAGLICLWSIANWGICGLLEGKGRLNEVFCVTTYSFVPLIVGNILFTIFSNVLPLSSSVVLDGINTVALIITAFLLIVGTITIHEYSFSKFVLTSILTILGMILIVFVVFVIAILLQQLLNFFVSVYTEITYR